MDPISFSRLLLWSLNPISSEWSEANLIFKVRGKIQYYFSKPLLKNIILSKRYTLNSPFSEYVQ